MENLDEEIQLIVVEKVLDEMQKVEEFVGAWNASWWERCLDAYSIPLYNTERYVVQNIEKKYYDQYKLENVYYPEKRNGLPLRRVILEDDCGKKYECEFGRIDWIDMNSRKSARAFSFNNNGIIKFSKSDKIGQKQTMQHPTRITYDITFDILSNDFDISFINSRLTSDLKQRYKNDYFKVSFKNNILIEKFNDIEIIRDLNTGMRLVKIVKEYDKSDSQNNASVSFEASLNSNDNLEVGSILIETHKKNGKVNGTYRLDVSRKKGIRANFYSRKGVKVDLTSNPILLETANTLLLTSQMNNSGEMIVSDFANSAQAKITKNLSEKIISFDNSDFNMESVNLAERRIFEMLKCIKGELPLPSLIDRINKCLEIIDKRQTLKMDDIKYLRLN